MRSSGGGDRVRRERDGDKTEDETADPGDETGDEMATTTGDKPTAIGGVMYTDEGELEFDEDKMAALEGQHLVVEFRCGIVSSSGSEPSFDGFHVSEPAGNLGGDDSGSEAVTESDDEGVTGRLSDAAAAAAYRTNSNLPD